MSIEDDYIRTPAGRLAQLLTHIKGYATRTTTTMTFQNRQVLESYLQLDEGDSAAYFAAVAEIMSMPVTIRRDVAALEKPIVPPDMLLQHMDRIEAALPSLGSPHGSPKKIWDQLGDDVVVGLQYGSRVLLQGDALRAIPRERLDEIRRLATEIVDDLANEDGFSLQFREEIRRHAQSIIAVVNGYKIHGADGLLDEADALVGVIARSGEASRMREHPAMGKILALGNTVVLLAGVYAGPAEIAESTSVYSHVLELPTTVEAPGEDIVDAEVIS